MESAGIDLIITSAMRAQIMLIEFFVRVGNWIACVLVKPMRLFAHRSPERASGNIAVTQLD